MNDRRFTSFLKPRIAALWVGAILLAIGLCPGANAAVCTMAKLLASDGAAGEQSGYSVAVSANVAVVGAYLDDDNGLQSGSAYVYRWNGSSWVEEAKLLASDGAMGDQFGYSVAVSGDVALVGADGDDDNGGESDSAYVYRWNGSSWVETKLLASDGTVDDRFGRSVAVSGDVAVVGAQGDDDNGYASGSAYVYRWNGASWVETKLLASDGTASDYFGGSVAVSGDVALVGASGDDVNGAQSGSAYVYRRSDWSWEEEAKLLASDGFGSDQFGASVAVSGDMAVVGAPGDDDNGAQSGSAYVYRWNGSSWAETKLLASDGAAGDGFGYSAAASGDVAMVGAPDDDGTGSAYAYGWNGSSWIETKLLAPDGALNDNFGWSVGMGGDVAVVGAPGDDDNGSGSGSEYVLGGVGGDCNDNGEGDACEIMAGTASDLDGNLTPDECDSFAYNLTQATFHDTIADAIVAAVSGDDLVASPLLFVAEPDIDFEGKAVTLISFSEIDQPAGGLVVLADGGKLETAAGSDMTLGGELRTNAGDTADVDASLLTVAATGTLACGEASRLDMATTDGLLSGVTRVHDLGMLVFGGPVEQAGGMTIYPEAAFIADATFTNSGSCTVLHGGRIS
ncbi:MAG: FG-GAP repeat protein, partial [Planctomycetota bacterium]